MRAIKDMKPGDPRIKGDFTWMYNKPYWLVCSLFTVGWGIFMTTQGHWLFGPCLSLSQISYFTNVIGFEIWKDWLIDIYGI